MPETPIPRLEAWLEERGDSSFVLATASAEGVPSARTVLLKGLPAGELLVGTQLASRKGRELAANPAVAAVFTWPEAGRQVVVEGRARVCDAAESEALWRSRGRAARLADAISVEGATLEARAELERAWEAADAEHGEEVPRPADWAAVRIVPAMIEFWSSDPRRLSVRERWELGDGGWSTRLLQP